MLIPRGILNLFPRRTRRRHPSHVLVFPEVVAKEAEEAQREQKAKRKPKRV